MRKRVTDGCTHCGVPLAPGGVDGCGWHAQQHRSSALLRERGIDLSASQVYRLVAGQPERVSLQVMAAICDVFACTPGDLITVTAADKRRRRTATENVVDLNRSARPKRARVIRDE